jgi:hypothetical protein
MGLEHPSTASDKTRGEAHGMTDETREASMEARDGAARRGARGGREGRGHMREARRGGTGATAQLRCASYDLR